MKKLLIFVILISFFAPKSFSQCKCGTSANWLSTEMKIGDRAINKFKCGYQFTIKKYEIVKFTNGGYNCIDVSSTPCKAKFKVNIYKPGGGLYRTIDPFSFSGESIEFPSTGLFRVEILAMCNGITCKSCTYSFNVL